MPELEKNKLRRLDVSLLLIFLGIMRSGKASLVAADLGLTAPSISHALGRLREIFDDPLFLRRPHGLEPTAFARSIEPDIRKAVDALRASLAGPDQFDPETSRAHIRLSARDSELASTFPDALSKMFALAPHVTVSVQAKSSQHAVKALIEGELDLAVGFFANVPDELEQTRLRSESYLVVARSDHPVMKGHLSLEKYLSADHLLVSSDASRHGIVDDKLAESGQARHVILSLPQFMPALAVLRKSDMLATLPKRLVERHAARFDLVAVTPPLTLRAFELSLLRHRRDVKNPAVSWCLAQILETA